MNRVSGMRGRVALAEVKRRKNEADYRKVIGSELLQEKMQEMIARAQRGEAVDMSAIIQAGMETAANLLNPGQAPLPEDAASIAHHETMHAAYDLHVGIFIEETPNGFKVWDFEQIVLGMIKLEYDRGQMGTTPEKIWVDSPGDQTEIEGPALVAFLRYLHYTGIFMISEARKPCPECAHKMPCDCEHCGGLGWIVPSPETVLSE